MILSHYFSIRKNIMMNSIINATAILIKIRLFNQTTNNINVKTKIHDNHLFHEAVHH